MVISDFLERNARLYGDETALVEINPSEERDNAVTWRDFSLIENTRPDLPYRRELTWQRFDEKANRFANLLLSRGIKKGQKVAILLMNCLEWLPIYFGALKAGALAVPLNYRYTAQEIKYCVELADSDVLVFGPEFIGRVEEICDRRTMQSHIQLFSGPDGFGKLPDRGIQPGIQFLPQSFLSRREHCLGWRSAQF
jgi:acyl-CoA synthetase (AMP-forming)/AMP-acid ligase II